MHSSKNDKILEAISEQLGILININNDVWVLIIARKNVLYLTWWNGTVQMYFIYQYRLL